MIGTAEIYSFFFVALRRFLHLWRRIVRHVHHHVAPLLLDALSLSLQLHFLFYFSVGP